MVVWHALVGCQFWYGRIEECRKSISAAPPPRPSPRAPTVPHRDSKTKPTTKINSSNPEIWNHQKCSRQSTRVNRIRISDETHFNLKVWSNYPKYTKQTEAFGGKQWWALPTLWVIRREWHPVESSRFLKGISWVRLDFLTSFWGQVRPLMCRKQPNNPQILISDKLSKFPVSGWASGGYVDCATTISWTPAGTVAM